MIKSKADLAAAKRNYAALGFAYVGRKRVPGGGFKHVWIKKNCNEPAPRDPQGSRRPHRP
jgi:hypothetical protein